MRDSMGHRVRQLSDVQLLIAIIVVLVPIAALVLWILPALLTMHPRVNTAAERHKAISDARTGTAAVLAVAATAGGLLYTARTYRLTRRGQIADRYTKAIEQLSNTNEDIRIGGIYALEQVAREDAEYQQAEYQQTVIDVLAAYIRTRAPYPAYTAPQRRLRWLGNQDSQADPPIPGSDIHVALAILRRLVRGVERHGLDLRHSNLAGAHLMGMYLVDAQLTNANLSGAKLSDADLRGADLRGADLSGAQVYKADFTDAILERGQLTDEAIGQIRGRESVQWSDPSPDPATSPHRTLRWPYSHRSNSPTRQ